MCRNVVENPSESLVPAMANSQYSAYVPHALPPAASAPAYDEALLPQQQSPYYPESQGYAPSSSYHGQHQSQYEKPAYEPHNKT